MDSRRSGLSPRFAAAQRKQPGDMVCKDAFAVHADAKAGVIQHPAPQRSNALENFLFSRRRVLVQPVLEQRYHPAVTAG